MVEQFFKRSVGTWESHRSYLYVKSGKVVKCINTFTVADEGDKTYSISWAKKDNSTRRLDLVLKSDFVLWKSGSFYGEDPMESQIVIASKDCLKTVTNSKGASYNELIEFINDDTRIRRTIARKVSKDGTLSDAFLVGIYVEKKLCQDIEEDEDVGRTLEGFQEI